MIDWEYIELARIKKEMRRGEYDGDLLNTEWRKSKEDLGLSKESIDKEELYILRSSLAILKGMGL